MALGGVNLHCWIMLLIALNCASHGECNGVLIMKLVWKLRILEGKVLLHREKNTLYIDMNRRGRDNYASIDIDMRQYATLLTMLIDH